MRLIRAAWLAAQRCQQQAQSSSVITSPRQFSAIHSLRASHPLLSPPLPAASPIPNVDRIPASGAAAPTAFSARIAPPRSARISSAAPCAQPKELGQAQEGSPEAATVSEGQRLEGEGREGKGAEGSASTTRGASACVGARDGDGVGGGGADRPSAAVPTGDARRSTAPTSSTPWQGGRLPPTGPGEKPRVVVLGTGWAACRFLRDVDVRAWDVVCVAPRNHMVFTPLLASTCVGTLEFRSVAEPVEHIQPAVSRSPSSFFFLAKCTAVDPHKHEISCEYVDDEGASSSALGERWRFSIAYDKLVVAVGAQASTFGIRGVQQHAFFLREVRHAQAIRRRLLLNLMKSDTPGLPEDEKRRLLSCVVVGGGPTGVEFSGELSDFIRRDVRSKYAHVKDYIHVTLIEAREILSSFDVSLRNYAIRQLTKSGVSLKRGQVAEVTATSVVLTDGSVIPYGLLVWSTGVGPSDFVKALPFPHTAGGRIAVTECLRVVGQPDVFAMGDCAGYHETTGRPTLPALAQVAERQGRYLAASFNRMGRAGRGRAGAGEGGPGQEQAFVYRHLGSMATVGRYKALVDLQGGKRHLSLAGFVSWFIWRSAYLTRVISWRNRLYVAVNWATTLLFGRDISRI